MNKAFSEWMSEPIDDGGKAFPQHPGQDDVENFGGISIRDYFAAHVDVPAYNPRQTYLDKYGKSPTVEELAEYIANIRLCEAAAMIKARKATS